MWQRSDEQGPTQTRQHVSVGKIMLVMFWDRDGVLLTDYLVGGHTINGIYYASLIERLHDAILEKRQTGLVELNHPAYSPDIVPSDYHMFFHMKRFLRGKSFSSNDEVIRTVEGYLSDLDSRFLSNGIGALHDRWQRVVDSDEHYI